MRYQIWFLLGILGIWALSFVAEGREKDSSRQFRMGFSTWVYAPTADAVNETYRFIEDNADIYLEHFDDKLPWLEAIEASPFPKKFVQEMKEKQARRIAGAKLLLALTPLNGGRSSLAEPYSGELPAAIRDKPFNETAIVNAYITYCRWMVELFQPDYLITAVEANELLNNAPKQWRGYLEMSKDVRRTLKADFPDLLIAESVTLHKLIKPEVEDPETYRQQIRAFIADMDFAAISFYPFFVGYHTREQFASAFDFLRQWTDKPIAITETAHPAESMSLKRWNFNFSANPGEQNDYIQTLLHRAQVDDFLFVICFTWRDYDELWQTFPDAVKDLGRLWRDTGLVDEDGQKRSAMETWRAVLE